MLKLEKEEMAERKKDAKHHFMERPGGMGGGKGQADEKQIVKEGLSEYFIFTIEGTETIPNGWSKRLWHSLSSHASPPRIATCRTG